MTLRSVLSACLVLSLSLSAGAVAAQSLAEVAEKEKKRREELKKKGEERPVAFSNEDLPEGQAPASNAGTAARPAAPRSRETAADPDRDAPGAPGEGDADEESEDGDRFADEGDDDAPVAPASKDSGEARWRARAEGLRAAVASAQAQVSDLERRVQAEARGPLSPPGQTDDLAQNPGRYLTGDPAGDALKAELTDARKALSDAETRLADFEKEARSQGVPPGWIR